MQQETIKHDFSNQLKSIILTTTFFVLSIYIICNYIKKYNYNKWLRDNLDIKSNYQKFIDNIIKSDHSLIIDVSEFTSRDTDFKPTYTQSTSLFFSRLTKCILKMDQLHATGEKYGCDFEAVIQFFPVNINGNNVQFSIGNKYTLKISSSNKNIFPRGLFIGALLKLNREKPKTNVFLNYLLRNSHGNDKYNEVQSFFKGMNTIKKDAVEYIKPTKEDVAQYIANSLNEPGLYPEDSHYTDPFKLNFSACMEILYQ